MGVWTARLQAVAYKYRLFLLPVGVVCFALWLVPTHLLLIQVIVKGYKVTSTYLSLCNKMLIFLKNKTKLCHVDQDS
jgi:hypothetical protein